eukprot:TRINITY_DN15970_c0_g1_i3.p1 TRINITY_DN15970_c0_g1~~TRINITY_DN15970_c0_g1_i3.p1  ORF type:complete len:168 (-),score=14.28 TRINITY_DN15970_c0_g1_i3:317-820(-)
MNGPRSYDPEYMLALHSQAAKPKNSLLNTLLNHSLIKGDVKPLSLTSNLAADSNFPDERLFFRHVTIQPRSATNNREILSHEKYVRKIDSTCDKENPQHIVVTLTRIPSREPFSRVPIFQTLVPLPKVTSQGQIETDSNRLKQRQKQIEFGYMTVGYQRYRVMVCRR